MIGLQEWIAPALRRAQVWAGAVLAVTLVSCGADPGFEGDVEATETVDELGENVVYGTDNRQDVQDHSDAAMRSLARNSSVALIHRTKITAVDAENHIVFTAPSLRSAFNLCTNKSQRFLDDGTAAHCSGTLIDDDLVLTAAHCLDEVPCADTRFVFGYHKEAGGVMRSQTTADVFKCSSVVVKKLDAATELDYAIVKLDRKATPRYAPAPVRSTAAPLSYATRVGIIGSGSGIPFKIDTGGQVLSPRTGKGFFGTTTDSFHGNSGSGVYELGTYQLAGSLANVQDPEYVSGGADGLPAGCNIAQVCASTGCNGNSNVVAYVGPALSDYCNANPNNARLCKRRNEIVFSATNTQTATENTINQKVFLEAGAKIDFGTCGTPGSSAVGDTTIGLYDSAGALVSLADDNIGEDGCSETEYSHATYTVPKLLSGLYELRAGCYLDESCSGVVAYMVQGPTGGSFTYDESATNDAQVSTRDVQVNVQAGTTIRVGTCSATTFTATDKAIERAKSTNDTFLRLFSGAAQLVSNDDACGGVGSQLVYTAPAAATLTIKAGCSLATACSGTVSYTLNRTTHNFSNVSTTSATRNTSNVNVTLAVGDQITVGTCGLQGAQFTGDTFVRLFRDNTDVARADNGCGVGTGSLLTYRATTAGTYQARFGCLNETACTSVPVIQVVRAGAINGGSAIAPFVATATTNATRNTINTALFLRAGEKVQLGTCPSVPNGLGAGDTYLRLYGPDSKQVTSNDDSCAAAGGGLLSTMAYTVPVTGEGSYELRGGCAGETLCSGSIAIRDQ